MITNLFLVRALPSPLHVAQLDHSSFPPENAAFRETGIVHCFLNSNIYFWGDKDAARKICVERGWGDTVASDHSADQFEAVANWQILQVLLYRALNNFLRSMNFTVLYDYVYLIAQPEGETTPLVYPQPDKLPKEYLVHEGFDRSFVRIQGQIYLVLHPRIVISKPIGGGRDQLSGTDSIGLYTKINFRRRADKERTMTSFWAKSLSHDGREIAIDIPGSSSLIIGRQSLTLSLRDR